MKKASLTMAGTKPTLQGDPGDCAMSSLNDEKSRTDLVHRLKRAEGQLRGIQRMVEGGEDCLAIASQMSAVRKALDSAYVRMTVCFMEQELATRLGDQPSAQADLGEMLGQMEAMLGKIR